MSDKKRFIFIVLLMTASLHAYASSANLDGGKLYMDYCSVCHGDDGSGKSRANKSMRPPPRDFTSPQAAIELNRERMLIAVSEGRPGTAMAPWKSQLNPEQIAVVVDFIRERLMLPIATEDAATGRRLYAENCSVCHGDSGKGAQWSARNMNPPPRNFTSDQVRSELTYERMVQSVTFGRPDTAMPGFGTQLSEDEISQVVDFIRAAFLRQNKSDHTRKRKSLPGIDMSAMFISGNIADAQRGKALYLTNCTACHGLEGDGKGPRAYFILPKPRNFLHTASRNQLNRPALYEAIAKGSRGTEMPAWEKVLTHNDIEDLAEYVFQAFIQP